MVEKERTGSRFGCRWFWWKGVALFKILMGILILDVKGNVQGVRSELS